MAKSSNPSGIASAALPGLSAEPGQESALHMKPQLIDNLAYQIRTLSNAIIGFSNLLAAEDLNDTQRRICKRNSSGRQRAFRYCQ